MLAITRKCPPHCRQVSISIAKSCLSRCAQLIARCRSTADGSLASITLPAIAARVFGTIRARSRLAGANTPWYLVSRTGPELNETCGQPGPYRL